MSLQNKSHKNELDAGLKEFLETAQELFLPGVSIDTVLFSFYNDKLKVLLLRFANSTHFSLPSGFIKKEENLDDAALRILQERTGLKNVYLEQFYTAGSTARSSKSVVHEVLKNMAPSLPANNWLEQRFISVCYYALVDETKVALTFEPFISDFQWVDIKKIPKLLYDHNLIIEKALQRLQTDLDQKLVGFNLMNETFTMGELQKLYEAVYQKKLVRTNFQRKMLSLNVLHRLEKQYSGKAHKAPYLYSFKKG